MNWPVLLSTLGVLIAAAALLRTEHWRRRMLTTEKEKELNEKIDTATELARSADAELTRVRERMKHMPSQSQIAGLGQRIADLAAEVKGLHAGLDGQNAHLGSVKDSVARIESYLLNQGRPQ